jgi:hypothetical protein
LNRADGGFEQIETELDAWVLSDDSDVAAFLFVPALLESARVYKDFDLIAFQTTAFVSGPPNYSVKNVRAEGDFLIRPRVGTELFLTGLFTETYGTERNLPVARFGHLSRMPSLLRFTAAPREYFAGLGYLAEFQSWGGHSGSPVFYMQPHTLVTILVDDDGNDTNQQVHEQLHLSGFLGMISGHYDIPTGAGGEDSSVSLSQNSGMAIVVPAHVISALLARSDLVQERAVVRAKLGLGEPY